MENNPNNVGAPITRAILKAEFDKFEEKMDKKLDECLSEQADVILEAVDERMDKKLSDKFDPVITKLDAVLKDIDAHHDEDVVGATQLRRHDDQLQDHAVRIKKLEAIRNP